MQTEYGEGRFLANAKCEKVEVLAKPLQNFCEIAVLSQNLIGRNRDIEKESWGQRSGPIMDLLHVYGYSGSAETQK